MQYIINFYIFSYICNLLIYSILAAIVQSTLLDINDAKSCDLLCAQCNASAVFAHDRCECNFSDNNDKGIIISSSYLIKDGLH